MAELLVGTMLIVVLVRVLAEGDGVELDDLLGPAPLAATAALLVLVLVLALRSSPAEEGALHRPLILLGSAACGWLLVLFPERMPDTVRGGTMMTAFWSYFGWALFALAYFTLIAL